VVMVQLRFKARCLSS